MNQDVNRLEELLARVQRNAVRPRGARVEATDASRAVGQPPLAAEPAHYSAPPAPYIAPETFLDSVDELLADPFPASSAPPPPSADEPLHDEPLPLVSVAVQRDDAISGVMAVAELTEEPEELLEDDIVEMTPSDEANAAEEVAPPAHAASFGGDLNFDEGEDPGQRLAFEEEPPDSSSRTRFTSSVAEAIARADAAIELQDGREVPLKTPPPQSGPQAAMAPLPASIHAPAVPDLDSLLEADIVPTFAQTAIPTLEQLGQTVELDEARGPRLELDQPSQVEDAPDISSAEQEDLEASLPHREFGGGYQDDLLPPPEAREDLAAHLRSTSDASLPPSDDRDEPPAEAPPERRSGMFAAAGGAAVNDEPAAASDEVAAELFARPELSPVPVAKFIRVQASRPSTFLELLDASLLLGRD